MKCLFITFPVIIFLSCYSSPSYNPTQREPIETIIQRVEIDLHDDEGHKLYKQAVETYSTMYDYYDMLIIVDDIQKLVNGNYNGYKNEFEIVKIVNGKNSFYIINAQFYCINVILFFSKEPFKDGISGGYAWDYDRRYSNGENERQRAERIHQQEWNNFFESKYSEALLKLSFEKRKIPEEGHTVLEFNLFREEKKLEYYRKIKTLWFTAED